MISHNKASSPFGTINSGDGKDRLKRRCYKWVWIFIIVRTLSSCLEKRYRTYIRASVFVAGYAMAPLAHSDNLAQLYISGTKTCISFVLARVCDPDNARIAVPFYKQFDPNSADRQAKARDIVSSSANISNDQMIQVEHDDPITRLWNKKLKVIAKTFPLIISSGLIVPVDKKYSSWFEHQDLPILADITLSPFVVKLSDTAMRTWGERLQQDPLFEDQCDLDNAKVDCRVLFTRANIKKQADELIEEFEKSKREGEEPGDRIDAILMIRRRLAEQRFQKYVDDSLINDGRLVYRVHAVGFSPQVDFLGNLYIPDDFDKDWSAGERDLILDHEASHVAAFGMDYQLFLLQQYFSSFQGSENADLSPIYAVMRQPDEMIIDLLAAYAFDLSSEELKRSSVLLDKLEKWAPGRATGLRELSVLKAEGVPMESVLERRIQDAPLKSTDGDADLVLDKQIAKYRQATSEYLAYLAPGKAQALMGTGRSNNIAIHDFVLETFNHSDVADFEAPVAGGGRWYLRFKTISLSTSEGQ